MSIVSTQSHFSTKPVRQVSTNPGVVSSKGAASQEVIGDRVSLARTEGVTAEKEPASPPQKFFTIAVATKVGLSTIPGLGSAVAALVPENEVVDGVWTPSTENQEVLPLQVRDAEFATPLNENTVRISHYVTDAAKKPGEPSRDLYLQFSSGQPSIYEAPGRRFGQQLSEAVSKFEETEPAPNSDKVHLNLELDLPEGTDATDKTLAFLQQDSLEGTNWTGGQAPAPTLGAVLTAEQPSEQYHAVKAHFELAEGDDQVEMGYFNSQRIKTMLQTQQNLDQTMKSERMKKALAQPWVGAALEEHGLSLDEAKTQFMKHTLIAGTHHSPVDYGLSAEGAKSAVPVSIISSALILEDVSDLDPAFLQKVEAEVSKPEEQRDLSAIAESYGLTVDHIRQVADPMDVKVNGLPKIDPTDPRLLGTIDGIKSGIEELSAGSGNYADLMAKILVGAAGEDLQISKTENGFIGKTTEGKTIAVTQTGNTLSVTLPDGTVKTVEIPKA